MWLVTLFYFASHSLPLGAINVVGQEVFIAGNMHFARNSAGTNGEKGNDMHV